MPWSLRVHEYGGVEGIRLDDVPMPEPRGNEVRIKTQAFALNYGDLGLLEDDYIFSIELPSCFGDEASGIVDAIGPDVTQVQVGDRVSSVTYLNDGYPVNSEYFLFPEDYVTRYPENLSPVEGTSIWVQYLTAYYGLLHVADIGPDDAVLITAASSSAGIGATQIAKLVGATVIGTTRTSANREFILETGADYVIATEEEDVAGKILEYTGGVGVRVAYDPVGGPLTQEYAGALAQDAIIFLYGDISGQPTMVPITECIQKNAILRPHSVYNFVDKPDLREAGLNFLKEKLKTGELKPLIDKVFPLSEYQEAFAYQVAANNRRGKIVITTE